MRETGLLTCLDTFCLWRVASSFVSPTAYFLPTAAKSMQKMPPETDGFWTSFCVQELLPKFRRSRESAFFYSRCRYIGWLKGVVLLPGESILPSGRTTSFFIWAGAAAGLLLSQFPRHLISNETLEGKGNPKAIGFCWRSLVTFCRYWQKVTRRRQKSMLSETQRKNC